VSGCDFFPLFFGPELNFLEGSYTKKNLSQFIHNVLNTRVVKVVMAVFINFTGKVPQPSQQ